MGQTGQPECRQCCSNPGLTCSTKMYGAKAYLAYLVIFGQILAFFFATFGVKEPIFTPISHEKRPRIV